MARPFLKLILSGYLYEASSICHALECVLVNQLRTKQNSCLMGLHSGGGRQAITSPLRSWEDGDGPGEGGEGVGTHLDRWDGAPPTLLTVRWNRQAAGFLRLEIVF